MGEVQEIKIKSKNVNRRGRKRVPYGDLAEIKCNNL